MLTHAQCNLNPGGDFVILHIIFIVADFLQDDCSVLRNHLVITGMNPFKKDIAEIGFGNSKDFAMPLENLFFNFLQIMVEFETSHCLPQYLQSKNVTCGIFYRIQLLLRYLKLIS